jgi:hypothetical protein
LHQFARATGRRALFGGHVESVGALAMELIRPSENFVLFLALDGCALPAKKLAAVAETALRAGASYLCCWGPECSRFHTRLDGAERSVFGAAQDDRLVMAACREGETLEQALWYAVHVAEPSPRYVESTHSVVAVAIGNRAWGSRIEACLAAGAPLPDES